MKRWVPFFVLLGIAVVSTIYFLIFGNPSNYTPHTDDVAIIYREACADCHGLEGGGSEILYPSLIEIAISEEEIRHVIRRGALFMPAFPNISDSALIQLSRYIVMKSFRDSLNIKSED